MSRNYFVYMLASKSNGTLYVGVTNDLVRRVFEHRSGEVEGFTKRYSVRHLVWFDETADVTAAIAFEKKLKRWPRAYKIKMIEERNPQWRDLFDEIIS